LTSDPKGVIIMKTEGEKNVSSIQIYSSKASRN
jgi:hypothetical protein